MSYNILSCMYLHVENVDVISLRIRDHRITESQSHRISRVGRDVWRLSGPTRTRNCMERAKRFAFGNAESGIDRGKAWTQLQFAALSSRFVLQELGVVLHGEVNGICVSVRAS